MNVLYAFVCGALLLHGVVAFSPAPAPFWWLNTYLAKKSIGHFEPSPLPSNFQPAGPCDTFANRCSLDLATLPASIKSIGVSLPSPFSTNITLGQAVPQGNLEIWMPELSDVELADLKISGSSLSASREQINILIKQFKLGLQMNLRFINLIIPGVGFGVSEIDVVVTVVKAEQAVGTNISLSTFLDAPQGKTFSNALPRNISLNTCNLNLDLGLHVQLISGYPFQGVTNGVANFVIGIVQPILGYLICTYVINQVFTTFAGQPGIAQVLLEDVFDLVGNLSALPQPDVIVEEQNLVNSLTPTQRQASVFSFKNSSLVQATSQVLNGWLAPGNPPKVDDVITLLTHPNDGTFTLSDLQQFGISLSVPTPPFYVNIDLINATLSGLNTFQSGGFSILSNLTQDFTFGNRLTVSKLGVAFTANIELVDNYAGGSSDGWIYDRHLGSPSSASFQMLYNVSVDNADLTAFVSMILDVSQLKPLQIGQLLGRSTGQTLAFQQLIAAGMCGAPSLYGFAFPFLRLSIGNINVPNFQMVPVDQGIATLVNDLTNLGLTVLSSGIQTDLPDIVQQLVRPIANYLIGELFVSGGTSAFCPPYSSVGAPVFPDFLDSTLFATVSTLIQTVIGGDPVPTNSVNINEIIRIGISILINTLGAPGTNPSPGTWQFQPDFRLFPGRSFVGDQPSFRPSQVVLNYFNLFGLNTVNKLLVNTLANQPTGLDLTFQMASVGFAVSSRWTVDYTIVPNFPGRANYVDEGFVVQVTLSGLAIRAQPVLNYDLNMLYQFQLGQVLNLWCLVAPLLSGSLNISITISNIQVVVTRTTYPNSVAGNELQLALQTLSAESYSNLQNMVNYILYSIGNFARQFLTKALPSLTNLTPSTCLSLPNPFDTVFYRVFATIITSNFTELALQGLGAQPTPLTPAQAELGVFIPIYGVPWDFTNSFVVPLINNFATGIGQASYVAFLQKIGSTTSNLFQTNQTDGSVAFNLNFANLVGPLPINFFIQGGFFIPRFVSLTRISNLRMDNIQLLKVVGKYTTATYLNIPGSMQFSLAFAIQVPKSFKNPSDSSTDFYTEEFLFEFDLNDLVIDIELITAIDWAKLSALTIGNFVSLDPTTLEFGINWNFIDCLFGIFFQGGLSFPRLIITLETSQPTLNISPNVIVSQGTEQLLQAMTRILFDFYILNFADISQGFIRTFLNDYIFAPNVDQPNVCNPATVISLPPNQELFNFKTNPTVAAINDFIATTLAGSDGQYTLFNAVLEAAFEAATFFPYNPSLLTQTLGINDLALYYKGNSVGLFNLSITDIKLSGAGTFETLNILQPVSNASFFNQIHLKGPSSFEFDLRYAVNELFTKPVHDDLKLKFSITNVTLAGLVYLELVIPALLTIPLGGLTNITQLSCALTAVQKISISQASLNFVNFYAEISCVGECLSPLLAPLNSGLTFSTAQFNSLESIFAYAPGLVAAANSVLTSTALQAWLSSAITNSENSCRVVLDLTPLVNIVNAPAQATFHPSIILALGVCGMVAACVLLAPLGIPRHYNLKNKLLAEHLRAASEEPGATATTVARYMAKMEREALPLAWHPSISWFAKLLVPVFAIVSTVFLFLSFLTFSAFSIDLNLVYLGNQSNLVHLIPLTIGLLIDNVWNSGSPVLALGLVLLSGVWPISKNIMLLYIWYGPKWLLFPEKRRFVLHILDVAGKVSFIEAFVLIIIAAGIRFNIYTNEIPLLQSIPIPADLLIVNILVTVDGGMVILCVAAMATLSLNHFIIWQHEKAAFEDRRLFKQIDGEEDLVLTAKSEIKYRSSDYIFSTKFIAPSVMHAYLATKAGTSAPPDGPHDRFDPRAQNLIILATGFTSIILLIAQCLPFFSFHYDGLIGYGIELVIANGRVRTFSLMDLGIQVQFLTDGTAFTNFKLFFFQMLWYISVIIAPHLQLALHLCVWMIPMKLERAKTVFFFAKAFGYWACVDLFCVAVIAMTFVTDSLVSYLLDYTVGGMCSAAQPYLTEVLGAHDGVCLRTVVTVEYGFYITFVAMVAQISMGIIMIRANQIVLRDREDLLENRPHQMWSWIEYGILRFMFVHGAEHHRPFLNPSSTMLDKMFTLAINWLEDPKKTTVQFTKDMQEQTVKGSKSCCSTMCSCFRGVDSVDLAIPVGHGKTPTWEAEANPHHHVESGAGKWNVPPQVNQGKSSKWNPAPQYAPPSRGTSQASSASSVPPQANQGKSSKWKQQAPPSRETSQASSISSAPPPVPSMPRGSNAPAVPPPPASLKVPRKSQGPPVPPPSASLSMKVAARSTKSSAKAVIVKDEKGQEAANPIFKREKAFSLDV